MIYKKLSVKGVDYYYLELGEEHSSTLFFLGGANQEPDFDKSFYTGLAQNYHVITLCYPGIGNKYKLAGMLSTKKYLDFVDSFIKEKFADKEFYICGISLGAYLSIKYIGRSKGRNLLGFIGISPLSRLNSSSLISLVFRYSRNEVCKFAGIRYRIPAPTLFRLGNLKDLREKYRQTQFAKRLVLEKRDVENLKSLRSLVIFGKEDNVVDVSYTEDIFSHRPNTKLAALNDRGHEIHLTSTEKVIREILDFV